MTNAQTLLTDLRQGLGGQKQREELALREHPTSTKVHYSEGSLVRRVRVRVGVKVRVGG